MKTFNGSSELKNGNSQFRHSESGLLAYAGHVSTLSTPNLEREQVSAGQQYQADPDAHNTLRLALALMQSSENQEKQNSAKYFLRKLLSSNGGSDTLFSSGDSYRGLARFLLNTLENRDQLVAERASLEQKLEKLMFIESQMGNDPSTTHSLKR